LLVGEITPGTSLSLCGARIIYTEDGVLRACDDYRCEEVYVKGVVGYRPAPPIHSPFRISDAVYIEFDKKILVNRGDVIWAHAPLEIILHHKNSILARLAPGKVKYTLVGNIIEGVIARYAKSKVARGFAQENEDPCMAHIAFYIAQGEDTIRGVPFNAAYSHLYTDNRGTIFYSLVEVHIKDTIIESRTTSKPPMEGLKRLKQIRVGRTGVFSLTAPVIAVERGWKLWPSLKG